MTPAARFRPALAADLDALLRLQAAYYEEDGYVFSPEAARRAWQGLLADAALGRAWVAEAEGALVGYVVLALGYSLEYLGRDAFVDEIFLVPAWRGKGLGGAALALAEEACARLGVTALHLEVEPGKDAAEGLYRRRGFVAHTRVLMTKRLGRGAGPS